MGTYSMTTRGGLTNLSHPGLDDPCLMLLCIIKAILVRITQCASGHSQAVDFVQSIINRTGDDVHLRERPAEMCDTTTVGNEEGDEYYMRGFNTLIEENSDGHEACCTCTICKQDLCEVEIEDKKQKMKSCLCIEEKDPCVYCTVSFVDAMG